MKFILSFLLMTIFCLPQQAQQATGMVENPAFENEINRWLGASVPYMNVDQLKIMLDDVQVLDAREQKEYNVSHIPSAQYIGYKNFSTKKLPTLDKSKPIVVYCSIGYRSEKIGEKLQKEGFTNVYNLYGSIFEWSNRGYSLENIEGDSTQKVHTFNKKWSKWVTNPDIEKIY